MAPPPIPHFVMAGNIPGHERSNAVPIAAAAGGGATFRV